MTETVHINFDGKLIGKGRPRFGRGRVYTPAKTLAAETSLGFEAKVVMRQRGLKPLEGPIKLTIHTFQVPPKSRSKDVWPTGKPDADNVLKLAGDALNKIVWNDDSQIVMIDYSRFYGPVDRVFIRVEQLA